MSSFALLRHLLKKDVLHQRVVLSLTWSYALLVPWTPGLYDARNLSVNSSNFQGFYLLPLYALILLSAIRLLLLDPPGRGTHFLVTRPISGVTLAVSKILFLGLLFAPLLISKFETILLLQVSFNGLDFIFFTLESLLFFGAVLAFATMSALFLKKLTTIFLVLILGAAFFTAIGILNSPQPQAYYSGGIYRPDPQLEACQWLMFYLGLTLTFLLVLITRYGAKLLAAALGFAAVGILVSFLLLFHWPIRLDEVVSGEMFASVPSPLRDQLQLTTHGRNERAVWNHHTQIRAIDADVDLAGLEPPYFVVEKDFQSDAPELGMSSSFDYGVANAGGGMSRSPGAGIETRLKENLVGFSSTVPPDWNRHNFDVLNYTLGPNDQDINWYGKTIQGTVTLELRRMVIAQKLPLASTVAFDLPRRHNEVQTSNPDHEPGAIEYRDNLLVKRIPLILRGDYATGAGTLSWLVVNRDSSGLQGECLVPSDVGEGFYPRPLFYQLQLLGVSFRSPADFEANARGKDIPQDWIGSAEIYIFQTEPCGRIKLPFELKMR